MYKFYYSYKEEIYGVLEHKKEDGVLVVELIRKGETEKIKGEWLIEKIEEKEVDIAHNVDHLYVYKEEFLSDHLPTSS